jgi:hypothetical protein
MEGMRRMGTAAAIYGVLGVLWWATARIGWTVIACDDWGCLPPALGVLLAITVAVFGVSAVALERAGVRPGVRVALVTAAMLLVLRAGGEALPSWSSRFAHVVASAGVFAVAGAVAAFVTDGSVARRWRVAAFAGAPVVVFTGLAVLWWRS